MNLSLDLSLIQGYTSPAQQARRLTEAWVSSNMYCPRCGELRLNPFEANRPVADFFCPHCQSQFELKSKASSFGASINDGAFHTMIARIESNTNPDFFLMRYSLAQARVQELLFIPKHFFTSEIIQKRKPLAATARRAGWVGCNILLGAIPVQGRLSIVQDGAITPKEVIIQSIQRTEFLASQDIPSRGWLMDVLNIVNSMPIKFSLDQMYSHEQQLQLKHPENHHIRAKIRQQLQILRDNGIVEFLGGGQYRRVP